MQRAILVLGCGLVMFSQIALGQAPPTPKHGGKIESKYDGFTYETIMRLQKMKVSCDGVKDKFTDACVSIEVTLHLPGMQLNYVRQVTLMVVFENQDWVRMHPPEERDLSISTYDQTFRLGRMELITNKKPGTWDTKIERLQATVPYETFKKIIESDTIEIQVGKGAVMLREKNIAALRDLNNRVLAPPASTTTGTSANTSTRSRGK
ncbi:MAG TPA: hypothetical protein VFI57_04580 [Pyrinomonadaceae bacterium]|nr:hypothetical protein [Pyrinomonadaceae bacterium]